MSLHIVLLSATTQTIPVGWSQHTTTISGKSRIYKVYVPAGNTPSELLLHLHGVSGTIETACEPGSFNASHGADLNGAIAACPQALPDKRGQTCWHAFPSASFSGPNFDYCDHETPASTEDFALFDHIIAAVKAAYTNVSKTYLSGCSRGSSMAWRVQCERADMVDGIMTVANQWYAPEQRWGSFSSWDEYAANARIAGATPDVPTTCVPSKPLNSFTNVGNKDWNYRGHQLESWKIYSRRVMGCSGEPLTVFTEQGVRCLQYASCTNSARNRYCEHAGVGHWCNHLHFKYATPMSAQREGWEFLTSEALPPFPPQTPPLPPSLPPPPDGLSGGEIAGIVVGAVAVVTVLVAVPSAYYFFKSAEAPRPMAVPNAEISTFRFS
jgi:poly(3-hydroxybutyrate) depolymerase